MRARPIDDRAPGVVGIVGGHQRSRLEAKDAGKRSRRGRPEQFVDLGLGRSGAQLEDAIGQRGVQHRRPDGVAVQAALELGVDQRDGGGAAGRGRLQRQHRRAGAAQILVRGIDDDIGVGRVVDRGDLAVPDADGLVDHLHHRRQTVGGAGRGGQQPMTRRLVEVRR